MQAVGSGSGGWFVYSDGQEAPDPDQSDPNVPFDVPDPPQGKFAAVTDMSSPDAHPHRDVELDGRYTLHLTAFYAGSAPFSSPHTLAHDADANQQFRIDLIRPSAPIDSVAKADVLVNVFHTLSGDPPNRQISDVNVDLSRWAGQTVRLRLAQTDNRGPLRVGVDDIRLERIGADADARVELPDTPEAASAVDLVLRRLTKAEALAALTARAEKLAARDQFSGTVLVARDGKVLLEDAWGHADRDTGTPNTLDTKFRIGSMNKMFTAVATLQLVEAGKLALDDTLGEHLPDYPNEDVASKVTVRHLLTHTGGTGDIFGPEFELNRSSTGGARRLRRALWRTWAQARAGRAARVLELRLRPARRADRGGERRVVLRLRSRQRLPPGRHDIHGLAPEAEDVPNRAVGYMKPFSGGDYWTENHDHAAGEGHFRGWRLLDGGRPPAVRRGARVR